VHNQCLIFFLDIGRPPEDDPARNHRRRPSSTADVEKSHPRRVAVNLAV